MSNIKSINIVDEAEEISSRIGLYIPPSRLAVLMKTATKALNTLTSITEFDVTYKEIKLMLDMIGKTVATASCEERKEI